MFNALLSATTTPAPMSTILDNGTTVLEEVVDNVVTVANTITNTPFLMLGVGLMLAGFAVSMLSRLIRY